ncbi:hypothetical protein ISN44_As06g022060 [Arabidopsis suecica]|uniref:Uncharacterized protein n=1 Tax=Arabidopsis suecica TaxID=45249 RepID=A0A8T2CHX4_ARASU|nr:hypothetical protein ISN44_As06g022060 [Arabidopsis suecica]
MAEKVSLKHEIDYNPKPEDAGRIKVYVTILVSEYPIRDCRPVLAFSLPAKEFRASYTRYKWEQLNCLEDDERLDVSQVNLARTELSRLVTHVMFYLVNYLDCALSIYITFKPMRRPPAMIVEEYLPLEETMISEDEEDMRLPVDESVMHIQEPNWNIFYI